MHIQCLMWMYVHTRIAAMDRSNTKTRAQTWTSHTQKWMISWVTSDIARLQATARTYMSSRHTHTQQLRNAKVTLEEWATRATEHGAHAHKSFRTYKWIMSQSNFAIHKLGPRNQSYHTCEWVVYAYMMGHVHVCTHTHRMSHSNLATHKSDRSYFG